jgi:hypothetical protein
MSRFLTPLVTLAFVFAFGSAAAQTTVQSVFTDGVKLYKQEKYEDALAQFERILKANPRHVYARNYSTKCKNAIASGAGPKNDLEGQIAKIVIPQISFTDAPIGDVLQYLTSRAEEITGGKLVPNFIYKGTPEQRQNTTISLTLKNVPMTEAIRYVGQLSRTRFSYEEHAIVADPNAQGAPNAAIEKAIAEEAKEKSGTVFGEKPKTIFD